MSGTVSEDDRGKTVENERGETVGTIASVDDSYVHVRPKRGLLDSIKSSLGWDRRAAETISVHHDAVGEITDEAVRLEGELLAERESDDDERSGMADEPSTDPTEPTGTPREGDETEFPEERADDTESSRVDMETEDPQDRGLEVDPTDLTEDDSGLEVHPDDAETGSEETNDSESGETRDHDR
ncbi:hypothetical protein AB7C87_15715 [Natrarchaeobius sp. A-rgal3]|uniref:hypothetical protein n=1 Tax=Natrarchaeobius versutus TaxID=1679078 RepID=UPI00350F2BB6